MSATQTKYYSIGQNLTDAEASDLAGGVTPGRQQGFAGWHKSKGGQNVYICDGSHRDGTRGYKVLDLGGLK